MGPYSDGSVGRVLVSLPYAAEPIDEYTTQSVMHGQCDDRPTITLARNQPFRPTQPPTLCGVGNEY